VPTSHPAAATRGDGTAAPLPTRLPSLVAIPRGTPEIRGWEHPGTPCLCGAGGCTAPNPCPRRIQPQPPGGMAPRGRRLCACQVWSQSRGGRRRSGGGSTPERPVCAARGGVRPPIRAHVASSRSHLGGWHRGADAYAPAKFGCSRTRSGRDTRAGVHQVPGGSAVGQVRRIEGARWTPSRALFAALEVSLEPARRRGCIRAVGYVKCPPDRDCKPPDTGKGWSGEVIRRVLLDGRRGSRVRGGAPVTPVKTGRGTDAAGRRCGGGRGTGWVGGTVCAAPPPRCTPCRAPIRAIDGAPEPRWRRGNEIVAGLCVRSPDRDGYPPDRPTFPLLMSIRRVLRNIYIAVRNRGGAVSAWVEQASESGGWSRRYGGGSGAHGAPSR